MKELRFRSGDGVWRLHSRSTREDALSCSAAAAKPAKSQRRFYKRLIERADRRYASYLREHKEK
jgi:hypothetical protein